MNFSSLFKTDVFQFTGWILQKNEQNNKKLSFSHVCDATVCIFVPVLDKRCHVLLELGFVSNTDDFNH